VTAQRIAQPERSSFAAEPQLIQQRETASEREDDQRSDKA
jgi:hypothetical protein